MAPVQKIVTPLRNAINFLYDLQKLRIQAGNRGTNAVKTTELTPEDKLFLDATKKTLRKLETDASNVVKRHLKGLPIWEEWLSVRPDQTGCGPTMSAVLIAYINIERAPHVSSLWRWCGLAVIDGKAERRVKGQKCRYNPWLKSKILEVLGTSFLKACSIDNFGYYTTTNFPNPNFVKDTPEPPGGEGDNPFFVRLFEVAGKPTPEDCAGAELWKATVPVRRPYDGTPWRQFYDNRKHRRQTQTVQVCMGCDGKGEVAVKEKKPVGNNPDADAAAKKKEPKMVICANCDGTGGPAPWGASDSHRHNDSMRWMIKNFLEALWIKWRTLEGLPVGLSYAEAKQGLVHTGGPNREHMSQPAL